MAEQSSNHVPFLRRVGRFSTRYRWWIVSASLVLMVGAAIIGSGVIGSLLLARFEVSGSEADRVNVALAEQFGEGSPNLMLMLTARNGIVDDPELIEAGQALTAELEQQENVTVLSSYWGRDFAPALRSKDGKQAIIIAHVSGTVTEAREQLHELSPAFTRENALFTVGVGGEDEIFRQVGAQSERDFIRSDMIAIPLILLLLVLVYRNVSASLLTLGTSIFAILVTLFVLRILVLFTEVSTFALNLTMVLGLGIGVDYCLFVVARFREEMDSGKDVHAAVIRTVETAGRTVAFSALTVAISLAGLLLFPFYFLRSFAYAGITVIAAGALSALIVLPAVLAILGQRIRPWAFWGRRPVASPVAHGFWHRTTLVVMKRPLFVSVVVVAFLLFLGSPFLRLNFGTPDQRILPPEVSSRQVHEALRLNFPAEENDAVHVVAANVPSPESQLVVIDRYATELSRISGVFQVDALTGSYSNGQRVAEPEEWSARFIAERSTWFSVVPSGERLANDPFGLVEDVRTLAAPFDIEVGGATATIVDFRDTLLAYVPLVAGFIVIVTFILLFLMTGSLVVPVKATVLNILSLVATFGALVWIFQEGNLSDMLGFTATGTMEVSIPILMFCLAFGLSMDYEVFIMSRIKEEYDRTGDNELSVAVGLERSGPLVTAAAALLTVAFIAFATSGITLLKMLGVGMALAVIMDATLIRMLLVPAFMRMMGRVNWWAPVPLRRLQQRIGLSEAEPADSSPTKERVPISI